MKLMSRINDTANWGTSKVYIEIEDKNQNNLAGQRDVTVSFLPGSIVYQDLDLQKKTASITVDSVIADYGISSGGECKFL
jgi:hypothetical protein